MKRIALAACAAVMLAAPAASAGGGCHSRAPTAGTDPTVSMKNNCFTATVLWVEQGETVRFVNDDVSEHQVIGLGELFAPELKPGMRYEFTFRNAGVFPYACWLHPGMTGVVVAGAPERPAGTVDVGSAGLGEVRGATESTEPVAGTRPESGNDGNGTAASAAVIAGALMGTIGFVAGRRRRESV